MEAYTRGKPQLSPSRENRIMRGESRDPADSVKVTRARAVNSWPWLMVTLGACAQAT